jgi:hypothetical protein
MVIGAALAVVVLIVGISRAVDAFAFPDVVDASSGVWIDDPGGKVIFVVGPERTGNQFVPAVEVAVTDPDGAPVRTSPYSGSRSTSDVDGRTGTTLEAVAVATFHADRPGRYHLTATNVTPGSTLGVGEGVGGNFGLLGLGAVGGGLLVLTGLVVVVVTAVRRHRRPPMPPGGPYPYAYPGYPSGAPGSFPPPTMPPPPPGYPVAPPAPPGPPGPPPGAQAGRWWEAPQQGQGPESGTSGPLPDPPR